MLGPNASTKASMSEAALLALNRMDWLLFGSEARMADPKVLMCRSRSPSVVSTTCVKHSVSVGCGFTF